MKTSATAKSREPAFLIRVHLTDGSVQTFEPIDEAEAKRVWDSVEPARVFNQPRLVLAGEHYKAVFVSAQVVRLDFVQATYDCWKFPGGYADIVELSADEFRKHARLDQPELMPRRKQHIPVGDMLVSFLELRLAGGRPLFLMTEFPVKLPAENHSFMQFLLSRTGFHLRLRGGGYGVVNLANLLGYTVFPGVPEIPADTWLAERVANEAPR